MRIDRRSLVSSKLAPWRRHRRVGCSALLLLTSCAAAHTALAPGTASLVGTVRLVPHEGLRLPGPGGSYGDRALRDAELVDYSKPGFAVVSVAGLASPGGVARVSLRSSRFASRFDPRFSAVGVGGSIAIRNDDARSRAVSCPAVGVLTSLEPGRELSVAARRAGELRCFALDGAETGGEPAEASIYVAPGPFTVVGSDGQFRLDGLRPPPPDGGAPGARLELWHPRFPPVERAVALVPGSSEQLDLELQVR